MPIPVEDIPNDNLLSRYVFLPDMYRPDAGLLWQGFAQFETPGPDQKEAPHESVAWRKYLVTDTDVHSKGQTLEQYKRQRRNEVRYVGFGTAQAVAVRGAQTSAGHGYSLMHEPEDGADEHTRLSLRHASGEVTKKFRPTEKNDLRELLSNIFRHITHVN